MYPHPCKTRMGKRSQRPAGVISDGCSDDESPSPHGRHSGKGRGGTGKEGFKVPLVVQKELGYALAQLKAPPQGCLQKTSGPNASRAGGRRKR